MTNWTVQYNWNNLTWNQNKNKKNNKKCTYPWLKLQSFISEHCRFKSVCPSPSQHLHKLIETSNKCVLLIWEHCKILIRLCGCIGWPWSKLQHFAWVKAYFNDVPLQYLVQNFYLSCLNCVWPSACIRAIKCAGI